jgi:hypothetical protein
MRYVTMAAILLVAALLGQGQATGQKKDISAPPYAKVTLGGEIRDLLELRAKQNLYVLLDRDIALTPRGAGWKGPPPKPVHFPVRSMQVGDASWVVVLLQDSGDNLTALLPKVQSAEQPTYVVFEGAISAAPRDPEPFVAHANATGTLRLASKGTLGMGEIRIEGQALPGKYEVGKGKFASLAIENSTSPILVTGDAAAQVAPVKGMARVSGKLIVQKQGPLVVEAQSIHVNPPAPKKKAK